MIKHDRVPEVSNVSLCHSADATIKNRTKKSETLSKKGIHETLINKPFDLPATRTDWQQKIRQLHNRSMV